MKRYLLLALQLGLLACKKDAAPAPAEQLPPATQTGAGTFGCLLNGQPWTPSGYDGRPNFILTYDSGYHGGALQIKCYHYTSGSTFQSIIFGAVNIAQIGIYPFSTPDNGISYFDTSLTAPCNLQSYSTPGTYRTGSLTLTRFDLKAGIVSGTFNFKLYQPGCDTIKITQGRFDYTL